MKVPKDTTEELLGDIRSSLATLETILPKNVDGFALSPTTKTPFNALWFRESLCWRMALFIGLGNLASALDVFLLSYNSVTEVSPEFVRLCEARAQTKGEQAV